MVRELKICLAGFGAVGQRFCRLLREKERELASAYSFRIKLTGVCTRTRGALIDPAGLDSGEIFAMLERGPGFDQAHLAYSDGDVFDMLRRCGAAVLLELTTLSIADGEPATSHIEAALAQGMHVITANKGPLAHHASRLRATAAAAGKQFLYETTVLDGTPLFNLVRHTLPGNKILGIRGILNSTTNFVLTQIERGQGYAAAIREAQRLHVAEADPSLDVDGWDGAAKICALANVLMDAGLTPRQAAVTSLRIVTPADVAAARRQGGRIKYVCAAKRGDGGAVTLSVRPEQVTPDDVLFNVSGMSSVVTLDTDLAGEMTIIQKSPTILQTAYGVYSDLIALVKTLPGTE